MSQLLIKPGDHVPGNMYFTTTRLHQELAGGTFVDVIVDDAHDPESSFPFKGNVDINKLDRLVQGVGAQHVPYISLEGNVNMAGGQPFSMANLREIHSYCRKYDISIMLDATRTIENAWFIREREDGYAHKSVREILREICDLTDGWLPTGPRYGPRRRSRRLSGPGHRRTDERHRGQVRPSRTG